jgi:predicted GNAT family N-acyltransferase
MPSVRIADFEVDNEAIRRVRFAVFVDEQHVPADIELDDRDAACVHVLAFNDGVPVGTGRIDLEKAGKVGRLAVMAGSRRLGAGSALMHRLHAVAEDAGLTRTWCHAQVLAAPFYRRLGYRVVGQVFEEADIPHLRMERELLSVRSRPVSASSRRLHS